MRKLRRRRTFAVLLNNLQSARADAVEIKELIFSERFWEKPFNLERRLNRREKFKQNRAAALAEWQQLAA